jgi:hypothetical protein
MLNMQEDTESLPDWNKPGTFSAGRDPLGLQAASVRLYTDLLPGLTNVTNRLRYFSFYCWVVRKFELHRHTLDEDEWSIFIRRAEAVYALACQIGDNTNALGMAGSLWAAKHVDIGDAFDFTEWTDGPGQDNQYLKASRGNFGQFYVASMQQMGMLIATRERIQAVTSDHGLKLADAFGRACPEACERLLASIESGCVSRDDCVAISDEAHPAYLDRSSEEAKLLLRYLRGERADDPTAPARRATLWNVLNIVERTGIEDAYGMRRELYVQDNIGTVAEKSLAGNLISWRAYFVNELCHIALELLLNALTYRINATSGSNPDTLSREIASKALRTGDAAKSLTEVSDARRLGSLSLEHETGVELAQLAGAADEPDKGQMRSAVDLLFSLWRRWGADVAMERIIADATTAGRSAAGIFRLLDAMTDRPTLDALAALVRRFIIGNHLLIAGEKLAGGTYTYRFIVDESGLVDGNPAEYTFTNPRIGNLITFAYDGGLLTDGDVADAGKALLDAIQPVSRPQAIRLPQLRSNHLQRRSSLLRRQHPAPVARVRLSKQPADGGRRDALPGARAAARSLFARGPQIPDRADRGRRMLPSQDHAALRQGKGENDARFGQCDLGRMGQQPRAGLEAEMVAVVGFARRRDPLPTDRPRARLATSEATGVAGHRPGLQARPAQFAIALAGGHDARQRRRGARQRESDRLAALRPRQRLRNRRSPPRAD